MTKFNTQKRARSLRKNQTPAEQLLWSKLRSHGVSGFKFRRQHPVDVYILDFYCHEVCLAVEIDGGHHAEEENRRMDHRRTAFLNKKGIHVIRFWNNNVLDNLDDVITEIDAILQEIIAKKRVDN